MCNVQCDKYINSVYVHCTDAVDLIFLRKSKLRQYDYKDPGFTNKPDCFLTIIPPSPPRRGEDYLTPLPCNLTGGIH